MKWKSGARLERRKGKGFVLIPMSSWPYGNFTHQRELGLTRAVHSHTAAQPRSALPKYRAISSHRGKPSKNPMIVLILGIFDIHMVADCSFYFWYLIVSVDWSKFCIFSARRDNSFLRLCQKPKLENFSSDLILKVIRSRSPLVQMNCLWCLSFQIAGQWRLHKRKWTMNFSCLSV